MPATRADISRWFDEAKAEGATHMLVKCDTFDSDPSTCCYPINIMPGEDPKEVDAKNSDRFQECYAMHLSKEQQMSEHRANHWEVPGVSSD